MPASQLSEAAAQLELHTAFFYGTLMHPKILRRVLGNDGSHLKICPAVLLDHTRHNVTNADYPGVVPYTRSKAKFDRELSSEECSVRGTLISGLTAKDMWALDYFEGDEYTREKVKPHPLGAFTALPALEATPEGARGSSADAASKPIHHVIPSHAPPLPAQLADLPPPIEAETYIYLDISALDGSLWSYEDFVRLNAWRWYGKGAEGNASASVVEERMSGADGVDAGAGGY